MVHVLSAILWVLFWVTAFAAVVFGITLILRRFMKDRSALVTAIGIAVIGTGMIYSFTQNTTFDEVFLDQLDDQEDLRWMTVERYQGGDEGADGLQRARLRIEDEDMIHQVLDDFKGLRLRSGNCHEEREYNVYIRTRLNHTSFFAGEACLNTAEIRDPGRDHLRTLDRLAEDESLEWEYE
ncbi:hypothetical protein [Alteribacter natronophilus]|uniref:hypothetical protein n=1 Tax=Alteribacter natronophilus TaxID=2583810 RepID=UPI00110EBE20|nr:hypothetical protein [Alteribacter natronophilus]TMW71085.1 hypothetical protein FGB90_14045 [Alteribacter natronophilus]